MTCPLDQDYLQLFIDDELEPLERLVLEEHLWGCKDCLRTLNQLKVLDWDLKRLPEPPLPGELATLRAKVIAELTEPAFTAASSPGFIQSQYSNLSHTVKFATYLPGSKLLNKYTATGYQLAARKGKEQMSRLLKKIIGI
jgi:anti-sigma factor RsiW